MGLFNGKCECPANQIVGPDGRCTCENPSFQLKDGVCVCLSNLNTNVEEGKCDCTLPMVFEPRDGKCYCPELSALENGKCVFTKDYITQQAIEWTVWGGSIRKDCRQSKIVEWPNIGALSKKAIQNTYVNLAKFDSGGLDALKFEANVDGEIRESKLYGKEIPQYLKLSISTSARRLIVY